MYSIHQAISVFINLFLIGQLIKQAWDGNDKAIILVIFLYPILIIVNSLIWWVLSKKRKKESKIYKLTTIGLIILFLPSIVIAGMY